MGKLIAIAVLLGFLVAASFALTGIYSHQHGGDNTPKSNLRIAATICLWPTLLLVPLDAGYDNTGYIALGISAVANGILYGAIAWIIALGWKSIRERSG